MFDFRVPLIQAEWPLQSYHQGLPDGKTVFASEFPSAPIFLRALREAIYHG